MELTQQELVYLWDALEDLTTSRCADDVYITVLLEVKDKVYKHLKEIMLNGGVK